jgi:16S rRNA (adenine1518-N6/adenine1519-N6)-dimethyltransferase
MKRSGFERPKRSLGQNFLSDPNTSRKIVDALGVTREDRVLEIGPGRGALTTHLLDKAPALVIALEKDTALAPVLKETFPGLEVVNTDALAYAWERLDGSPPWKIVGNLPYNIASPLMWEIFSRCPSFSLAVFMVQKEVGQRLTAVPGNKTYGALTAWVKNFVAPKALFNVPPTVFRPRPKVDSQVLSFVPLQGDRLAAQGAEDLSLLLKLCFQQRRKQMGTLLKEYLNDDIVLWFEGRKIPLTIRPEMLSPEDFRSLSSLTKLRKP